MERVEPYSLNEVLTSAQMNSIQDTALGIAQVPGLMVGPAYVQSSNGTQIAIARVAFLLPGSPNSNLATSGSTFTYSVGTVSADTRYYVYAHDNAGAVAFDAPSTTAPDAFKLYKTGDTTRRYICTFATDGSGAVLAFRQDSRGFYCYDEGLCSTDALRVLGNGHATSFTPIDLTSPKPLLPPHALTVRVRAQCFGKFGDFVTGELRSTSAGSGSGTFIGATGTMLDSGSVALDNTAIVTDLVASSFGTIQYKVSDAVAGLYVFVQGFYE